MDMDAGFSQDSHWISRCNVNKVPNKVGDITVVHVCGKKHTP